MKIGINTHHGQPKRALRGGSVDNVTWYLRTTIRFWSKPVDRDRYIGFRVVVRRRQ